MMRQLSPAEVVFAVLALLVLGWGFIRFCKAVTTAVADAWFARREQHTRRIIEMSKEDPRK